MVSNDGVITYKVSHQIYPFSTLIWRPCHIKYIISYPALRLTLLLVLSSCDIQMIYPRTFILLYKALVRPHVEYANSVWSPYKKSDIEAIEKIQKRASEPPNL